jgi:hypothetical protein
MQKGMMPKGMFTCDINVRGIIKTRFFDKEP